MLKIPINILLSLAVFVISAGALLLIFGSPKCDDLANTTAFYLKNSIDEVSKDTFYSWDEGGIPPDGDISYYRTAPIALCQDKGISYLETILGSTVEPQYEIYFEKFPESGGGIWTEAYPWSGGSSSSLRMWAYFRIGTGAFKLASKYLTKIGMFNTFMKKLYGVGKDAIDTISEENLDGISEMATVTEEVGMVPGTRPAEWAIEAEKTGEARILIDEGVTDGDLVKMPTGEAAISNKKLVISNTPQVIEIPVELSENGQLTTYYVPVFVKRVNGEITDMTTRFLTEADAAAEGYEILKVAPSDIYKDWLDTLPKDLKNVYEDIYIPEDETGGIMESINGKLRSTTFYQDFYQPTEDKLKTFIKEINTLGYRVDLTEMTTQEINGIKLGLINAIETDPTGEVAEMFLEQDGMRDRIAQALGKSPDAIEATHLKDFLNTFKLDGIVFIPQGMDLEVFSSSINSVADTVSNKISIDSAEQLFEDALGCDRTGNIIDQNKYQIIKDMAQTLEISEDDARSRAYDFINSKIFPEYTKEIADGTINIAGGTMNKATLTSNSLSPYFQELAQNLITGTDEQKEQSAIQLGNFLGFVQQNKDALPANIVKTRTAYGVEYFTKQAKKMIYLDGPQNMLNPGSFYARAFFANLATKGCEGNSICVYSYGSMSENPIYLDESADKYDVRVWRPVLWLPSWQVVFQSIPSNPRFYVVSPCVANAKIWKTTYNGKPTIFVYPEKVYLEGEASNYCYADEGLVNQYVTIWFLSDVGTVIQSVNGFVIGRELKGAQQIADVADRSLVISAVKSSYNYIADKVFMITDPITLAQGIAEGAIGWPGLPFKPLTWEQISKYGSKIGIKEIKTGGNQV